MVPPDGKEDVPGESYPPSLVIRQRDLFSCWIKPWYPETLDLPLELHLSGRRWKCLSQSGSNIHNRGFLLPLMLVRGILKMEKDSGCKEPDEAEMEAAWPRLRMATLVSVNPHSQAMSSQQPVTVQCQEAQLVVTANRDLFGTGRLVNPADLTLGPAACKHSSLTAHNTVTFIAGLHECGSIVQITPDSLIYRTLLNYDRPASNPVIIRSNPAVIPIECHYPRRENVSSNAIRPTWAPFSSTLSAEERLVFSLRLMNEDWSAERPFRFQLGDILNIQAEVGTESHVPLRLFVDSCVAAQPGTDSSPHYTIIEFNGCLVDGRSDDTSSAFITPRREDVLRFRIDVFRFAGDTRNLIYNCHLKVTPADQAQTHLNKACSFNKARNTWAPVEGTRDICSCCETGNCESPALLRRLNFTERWPSRRFRRHDANGKVPTGTEGTPRDCRVSLAHHYFLPREEAEADVVIGPVLLSRDAGIVGERQEGGDGDGVTAVLGVGMGLICAAGVGLAGAVLGGVGRRRCARASA
ncbi:LOW QUALITY PROTEIN: zona pellucida sperm-binding protein 3-like [Pterocles gutturalis]